MALSTNEAEYIALCAICYHSVWMKKVLLDCWLKSDKLVQIWCDNKSCIAIAQNPTLYGRKKHMDVIFHYIRELIAKKEVKVNYCSTDSKVVDILSLQKCLKFREDLGVCKLQSRGGIC